ncbi:type I secretion system permease/ATPase [Amphiplicatus metriothermophilus]|uniref:ATP-binding cassette, subfamily C, LapB n=1 Tax=Amphiplicatus metriothermophilus TaxID=1519374 RepID=A0A239PUX9_9PROT|nr:type I secretion system permease/ATPase [Amphiplicatus metriothermophilus]MBB5519544.1 ATP-binding cassette subfamily C protein LapB [Amphiplicatus metriothermophilus]SNT74109.1 ATP-binding cassette, subfamily C, LapB [Amphiplicatus metriothermophilus]
MSRRKSFLRELAPTSHWLFGPLRDNIGVYGQTVLAASIVNFLGLVSSFFIMTVYDRVLPNQAVESLIALTIGVLIAHVFDLALKSLRGYFVDIAGQRLDATVGARVFDNLMAMRLDARRGATGATAGLIKEFDNLRDFFSSATLVAVVDLPFIFLFIGAIALVGGPLALVPLMGVLAALAAGLLIQPFIMRHARDAMNEGHLKHAVLIETLAGLETVKSVAAASLMRERWRRGVLRQARISTIGRFVNQAAVNFAGFAQQISQVGVVVIGVFLVGDGQITTGALIASVILTGRAMAPLAQVAGLLGRMSGALASYRALDRLMATRLETDPRREYLRRDRLAGRIEFREVSFVYPGAKARALDEISFVIEPGERVAVLGRNGSGKSTIVRLITGVYEPNEGSVLVDDTDIRQIRPADLRANVGAVLQDVCLFSGSIRENIALGLDNISDEDVLAAAKIAGVHDFVGASEAGYDQTLAERGEGLSGGQRQAIALARALAPKPSILLLDEPTSALDAQAEAHLVARLERATRGRTLLLVTHRTSLLRLVDRVIVLDQGRVVIDGARDEIVRSMAAAKAARAAPAPTEPRPIGAALAGERIRAVK